MKNMKSTPKPSFITTTNDKPKFTTTNNHTKNPKECTRNPQPNPTSTTEKKNNVEQKKKKNLKPKNGAPTQNNETTAFAASVVAATATVNAKYKLMSPAKFPISRSTCIANPNHKHIKPKLLIWAELEQISWFRSRLSLNRFSGSNLQFCFNRSSIFRSGLSLNQSNGCS